MPAGVLALAIHTTVTHTTPFRPPGSRPAPGHCRLTSADSRPAMTGDRRRPRRPRQPRPCGRRRPPAGVSRLQPAPRPAPAAPVVLSHIIAACVPRQPRVRAHRPGRAARSRLSAPLPHPPARRRAAAHGVSDMPVTRRPGPEALPVRARSEGFRRPSWSGAPCPARARTERGAPSHLPRPQPPPSPDRVPTSTYLRHTNVLFSHPSEVKAQKDGRKVRSRWKGTFTIQASTRRPDTAPRALRSCTRTGIGRRAGRSRTTSSNCRSARHDDQVGSSSGRLERA